MSIAAVTLSLSKSLGREGAKKSARKFMALHRHRTCFDKLNMITRGSVVSG
jgi:hypothetical protein